MVNFKNKYLPLTLAILLCLVCAVQLSFIIVQINRTKKIPVFMPLLVPGEDYSSYDLGKIGVQSAKILKNAGRIGSTISLEDIIRGILLLEKKNNFPLSRRQKNKISAILEDAYKEREDLLQYSNEIREIEKEISVLGDKIYSFLTPEQKEYLIARRDRISLKEFEEPVWKELINLLEKDIE